MNSAKLIVGLWILVTLLGACAPDTNSSVPSSTSAASSPLAGATATPDEFAAVRTTFTVHCADCHGETGDGGKVKIDGKQLKVPSFKVGHALKHSDEDFVEQIKDGGDGMPVFKDKLKPNEITELVRFIRREFQGK